MPPLPDVPAARCLNYQAPLLPEVSAVRSLSYIVAPLLHVPAVRFLGYQVSPLPHVSAARTLDYHMPLLSDVFALRSLGYQVFPLPAVPTCRSLATRCPSARCPCCLKPQLLGALFFSRPCHQKHQQLVYLLSEVPTARDLSYQVFLLPTFHDTEATVQRYPF